jgi:predicted dehydrogenase
MADVIRIGLVGLDTSHVIAFTNLLNDPAAPHHIPGAKIVAGFPGGSPDIEVSRNRVDGYTNDLKNKHGIQILNSPEEVAKACDMVFIMSIDGRVHLDLFKKTLPFRRPTFMDKPFANSYADAVEMFRLAEEANIPLMSSSALRYADSLKALLKDDSLGPIVGCDAFGPMTELPEPPGYFWYGIHTVEILSTVMGAGWRQLQAVRTDNTDVATIKWGDGAATRMATLRGTRNAHSQFGVTIHRAKGFQHANLSENPRPLYAGMLEAALQNLPHGKSAIPKEETLEIIQIMEAANESRKTGKVVSRA